MSRALAVLNGVLMLGYPLAVYVGLTRFSARGVGLLLLVLLLPTVASKLARANHRELWSVLRVPLTVAALVGGAALFDDRRLILALPVAINLALLAHFGGSLRRTPLVERFARLQNPALSPAQVRYCRTVTQVWCAFFVLNAAVSGLLALFAPLAWWAAYTGLIAYIAIGALATVEYIVRKARFREYGPGLHDRLLARLFPPGERNPGA